jgi:hypothetical protein
MIEAVAFSEKSVFTSATRRHITEDGILQDVGMFFAYLIITAKYQWVTS